MGARCHFAHGKEELRQASDVKNLCLKNLYIYFMLKNLANANHR